MAKPSQLFTLTSGQTIDILSQKGIGAPAGTDSANIAAIDILNYSQFELTVRGIGADGPQPPFSRKLWLAGDSQVLQPKVTPMDVLTNVLASPSSQMSVSFYYVGDQLPTETAPYGLGYLSYVAGGKSTVTQANQLINTTNSPTFGDGSIDISTNFPSAGLGQNVFVVDTQGNVQMWGETGDGVGLKFDEFFANVASSVAGSGAVLHIGYNYQNTNVGVTLAHGSWTYDGGPTFKLSPFVQTNIGANTFIALHKFTAPDAATPKTWELRYYNDNSLRLADLTDSRVLMQWNSSGTTQMGGKLVFSVAAGGITGMSTVLSGTGNTAGVAHGLGSTPIFIHVTLYGTSATPPNVANVGATTFDVQGITGAIAWKAIAIL